MDKKTEWKMLFETNARLNSPEYIAFRERLVAIQRRCDEAIKSMGFNDLNDLAKAQNEANAELQLFHKMKAERECQLAEPVTKLVEAEPACHYDLEEIANELKGIAQDMAKYHSEYYENRQADISNAAKDKKRRLCEALFVAAFTVALTLFFEHFQGIIEFALEFFRSLA